MGNVLLDFLGRLKTGDLVLLVVIKICQPGPRKLLSCVYIFSKCQTGSSHHDTEGRLALKSVENEKLLYRIDLFGGRHLNAAGTKRLCRFTLNVLMAANEMLIFIADCEFRQSLRNFDV